MAHRCFGWVRQKPDHRDWHFQAPRRLLAHLAPTVDLQPNMGPYLDQKDIGSCGPNTADEMICYDQKVEALPVVSISRLFTYWVTRYLMGTVNEDSGVDNRTLMKGLNSYGFCPESLWPYDTSKFTQQPPKAAFDAALPNRINNYAAVAQNLAQMQGCLAGNFPFMFGFTCYQQLMSDEAAATGIITSPGPTDTPIGGHDMTCCGYTTVDRPGVKPGNKWPAGTFKLRQHWTNSDGSPWGDGGYGYIPFDYGTNPNLAGDYWVVNAIPGAKPTPPAPVPPGPAPAPSPPAPPSPAPAPGPVAWLAALDGNLKVLFKVPFHVGLTNNRTFLGVTYIAGLDANLNIVWKFPI
jgi:C1A family cysteine protease